MAEGARAASSVHALVSGRVQGVGFRWHVRERARELGLRGWVANLDDGRVEVLANGAVDHVEGLLAWLHEGPPAARVERVVVAQDGAQPLAPDYRRVEF